MAMTETRMTVDEYIDATAGVQEPTQLIDGVIVVSQPKRPHQEALKYIFYALVTWEGSAAGSGCVSLPLDVFLDQYNMYGPDILWYADEQHMEWDGFQHVLPDLVVEVRSPSTWHYDVGKKREMYEHHGLGELWLVDTKAREVRVLRRSGPDASGFDVELKVGLDEVLKSPQLPGFELPLREAFRL
jgi:Uma2 family endonuclease